MQPQCKKWQKNNMQTQSHNIFIEHLHWGKGLGNSYIHIAYHLIKRRFYLISQPSDQFNLWISSLKMSINLFFVCLWYNKKPRLIIECFRFYFYNCPHKSTKVNNKLLVTRALCTISLQTVFITLSAFCKKSSSSNYEK